MVRCHFHPSVSLEELQTLVTASVVKGMEKYVEGISFGSPHFESQLSILLKLQMPILSDPAILKISAHLQKGIHARILISVAVCCH